MLACLEQLSGITWADTAASCMCMLRRMAPNPISPSSSSAASMFRTHQNCRGSPVLVTISCAGSCQCKPAMPWLPRGCLARFIEPALKPSQSHAIDNECRPSTIVTPLLPERPCHRYDCDPVCTVARWHPRLWHSSCKVESSTTQLRLRSAEAAAQYCAVLYHHEQIIPVHSECQAVPLRQGNV